LKRIAISQSNYIPWKGYFDLIRAVDEFVLYDEVQFTKNDWRNRNQIQTAGGPKWLTIPVLTANRTGQAISETRTDGQAWRRKHWNSWQAHYAHAAHFDAYRAGLQALYLGSEEDRLSQINRSFLEAICSWLGIPTPLKWSHDIPHGATEPSERLVQICRAAGATHYLSGPAARNYLRADLFHAAGITVEWMDYSGYREYRQRASPFLHQVSALDLILNEGSRAPEFLKSRSAADMSHPA
jgi:hypothetical protein